MNFFEMNLSTFNGDLILLLDGMEELRQQIFDQIDVDPPRYKKPYLQQSSLVLTSSLTRIFRYTRTSEITEKRCHPARFEQLPFAN